MCIQSIMSFRKEQKRKTTNCLGKSVLFDYNNLFIISLNLTLKFYFKGFLASHFFKKSNNKLSKCFSTLNKYYFLIIHNNYHEYYCI